MPASAVETKAPGASPAAEAAAAVVPPLRGDLTATERPYLGRRYVIYKNPISLTFFRLPAAQAEAAALFDGRTPLGDLLGPLSAASRYWRALPPEQAVQELSALANQLSQAGLLQVRGASATERGRKMRELKKSRGFEMLVAQTLFFRKSLFDPDRLLGLLLPWVQWAFRPGVLLAGAAFVFVSLAAVVWNFDAVVAQGANFFTLSNLGLTWLLFIVVKVLHEFGHGLTAKRHGAEVHEMGFMFILFTPYLFCNVSDVWRAGKAARVATGAAGIIVELMIASAAVWLWLLSQPGLFNQMCFNTIVLCSVSTLLFNGNPLMKFDGYYILADVLEIPNLRTKSNAWVTGWAQRNLLGLPPRGAPAAAHEASPLFGVYAVAAYCYGWFIMFSISVMIFDLLKPYGLELISRTYVGLFLFVSVALPLYRLGRSVKDTPEFRAAAGRRGRLLAAAAAVVVFGLFFVPWTETIKRSAALEHARVEPVSASAPGFLEEVHAVEGQVVGRGELLGRLRNTELESNLEQLRWQRESLQVRQRAMTAETGEEARLLVPVLGRQIKELEEEMAGLERRVASLELRAPRDGVVRSPRTQELAGRFFRTRQPVFEIGDSARTRVLIALDEQQARKVRPGQPVRVIFTGMPGRVFPGEITAVPSAPAPGFSAPSLANVAGGDVPAELHAASSALRPTVPHFEAEARLEFLPGDLAALRAQSSARARIEVKRTTLGIWLRDRLYEAVNPQIRL
jgi:putative peptide zinc metalloprotease protein